MSQTVKTKNTLPNLLAFSLLALAASISYFTFELSLFIRQIPDILENVRITSEKIEPALDEITEIRDLIKPIITEVKGIREQIPEILIQIEKIRETIPPILAESAAIRKQLPDALSSADKASASVVLISAELNAYQPIANEALIQIEGTRKEIPVLLNRADAMIDRARIAAQEASSGVVTGALGGILSAPFRLVGNFGSSVLGLNTSEVKDYSKEDLQHLQSMTQELLKSGSIGDIKNWTHPVTQRQSEVTLQKNLRLDDQECRELNVKSWLNTKQTLNKTITACLNDDGEWENLD